MLLLLHHDVDLLVEHTLLLSIILFLLISNLAPHDIIVQLLTFLIRQLVKVKLQFAIVILLVLSLILFNHRNDVSKLGSLQLVDLFDKGVAIFHKWLILVIDVVKLWLIGSGGFFLVLSLWLLIVIIVTRVHVILTEFFIDLVLDLVTI